MDLGLTGRTAIVCGASSGIGLGIAESLAGEGANVVMFARRQELLEREAERIGGLAVAGDVTSAEDLERLVQTAVDTYGGVDILVNNSGGPLPSSRPRSTTRSWRRRFSCCSSRSFASPVFACRTSSAARRAASSP